MGQFNKSRRSALLLALVAGAAMLTGCRGEKATADSKSIEILNVSYDPTRELYDEINPKFVAIWKKQTGQDLTINMSHGGSGKQARAIMDGLDADVATLALAYDIDEIATRTKNLPVEWQKSLPHNSAPYTSTIVFLVRKGNPKAIKDWGDLVKPDVAVITPNPKTSGGARWNFLASWAFAREKYGSDVAAEDFARKLFANVPVLDSGARGATMTFVERGIGDVLLTWENEAFLARKEFGSDKFEIVVPSISILAEPPVAVLSGNTDRHGTAKVSEAYLKYLYTPDAQEVIAHNFYRPIDAKVLEKYDSQFPRIKMVTIDDGLFGGWKAAQKRFFADGALFDSIFAKAKK